MDFKKVFNFKQRIAELISLFKNIKTFDFLGRLKNITKDIPGLVALAGATLMFIGAFVPNYWAGLWGINTYTNLFQAPWGVLIFILTLGMLGLAYFKQIFWAGLTSALCFTISLIQAIAFPAAIKIESGGWVDAGVHVGFFFVLIGELAIIGAFALHYFVMNKNEAQTPAIEAEAAVVTETPVAEAVTEETAPVAEAAAEEAPAQAE
ncbi:MAG: hypothetical protein IKK10_01615 [Clostridia bacterium]|nr:hypothetical protein [Clostridia bacterium]